MNLSATDSATGAVVELCYSVFVNYMGDFNPDVVYEGSIDWDEYFGYNNNETESQEFSVKVLDNGNIEITLPDNKVVDIRFEFNMSNVNADEVLVLNDYKTQNYGYEVYTAKEYNRYWNRYIKYNNGYYSYNYAYVVNGYNKKTPAQILSNNWYLGDIDYQYDQINDQGELLGRIYRATLYFDSWIYSHSSANVMIQIVDGKLYVLTGVSNESDLGLMYEGMVEYEQFVNNLTLVEDYDYDSSNVYYDGGKNLSYTSFSVKYQNEYLTNVEYFYYTVDGQKQYIEFDYAEEVMIPSLDSPVTLPSGWNQTSVVDMSWNGTDYQIVTGVYNKIYSYDYTKIGDKYVNINSAYVYNTREVLNNIAELQYLYGVYNGVNWTYYTDYYWNYSTGMLMPEGSPVYVTNDDFLFRDSYIGTTAEGYSCYSFDYYNYNTVEIKTLSNGIEVYCQPGTTNDCYAKLKDGAFLRGYLMDEGYGYSFIPEYWYENEFDSRELAGALNLNASITVTGNKAVINKNILDKLSNYSDNVCIEVAGIEEYTEYYGQFNYSQLYAWFN